MSGHFSSLHLLFKVSFKVILRRTLEAENIGDFMISVYRVQRATWCPHNSSLLHDYEYSPLYVSRITLEICTALCNFCNSLGNFNLAQNTWQLECTEHNSVDTFLFFERTMRKDLDIITKCNPFNKRLHVYGLIYTRTLS